MAINTNNLGQSSFSNSGLPFNAGTQAIKAQRSPGSHDKRYPYGQLWIDLPNQDLYVLTGVASGLATWQLLASGTGAITGVQGTTNQIVASTVNGVTTISIATPSFRIPGSLYIDTGAAFLNNGGISFDNWEIDDGNLIIGTDGKGIKWAGGSDNSFIGTKTLGPGTGTVSWTNTAIAGDVKLCITRSSINASETIGFLTYSITDQTITVTSLDSSGATVTGDESSFDFQIFSYFEP